MPKSGADIDRLQQMAKRHLMLHFTEMAAYAERIVHFVDGVVESEERPKAVA